MVTETGESLSLKNLLSPAGTADPYPLYRRLRATEPIHWDPNMSCWVLTRYDDVLATLRDARFSSQRGSIDLANVLSVEQQSRLSPVTSALSRMILFLDPPDHGRLRAFMSRAFSPRALERLRSNVQGMVDRIVDEAEQRGEMDVMRELAYPIPLTVIAELLGVPSEDRDSFQRWSDDLGAFFGMAPLSQRETIEKLRGITEFARYLVHIAAQRRQQPQDDLMQTLVTAWEAGAISQDDLIGNCVLLLAAGHGTTTSLIGNGLLALLQHPDQMGRLREDPGLISSAVTELLRYVSPVQGMVRNAADDITIGNKRIAGGDFVFLALAAANRDPEHFQDPEKLEIAREEGKQIAFGHGMHHCIGAALARIEAEVVFATLLARFPTIELATDALDWEGNIVFRRLRALPVYLAEGRRSATRRHENVPSAREAVSFVHGYSFGLLTPEETQVYESMTFPKLRTMLAGAGNNSRVVAVGAAAGEQPAGLALAEIWKVGEKATLRSLYVEPEHRRRGVATGLMSEIEEVLRNRGCESVEVIYMTGKPSTQAVEQLLENGGYGVPQLRSGLAKLSSEALTTLPWAKRTELPPGFTICPWAEISDKQRAGIEESQRTKPWIPEELSPSHFEMGLHLPTSLRLCYHDQVVGWLLTHQLNATTLRFSSVWIRRDLQRVGRWVPLIPLVVEGGRRAVDTDFQRVLWLTSALHQDMMRFNQRWVAPYAAFYGETYGRYKTFASDEHTETPRRTSPREVSIPYLAKEANWEPDRLPPDLSSQ
jgi:cytochrome P450/GNAT superfamily N-acetyltransferase